MENTQPIRRIQRLCVFCGSSSGARPVYAKAAAELGRELAKSGVTLVFGGGRVGLKTQEVRWFPRGELPPNLTMTARKAIQAYAVATALPP